MADVERKINTMLYNTRNSKSKCRAEIIYCSHCDECSLYKNKKCLNVTRPLSSRCSLGRIQKVDGYTTNAAKYTLFVASYKKEETYGALTYPSDCMFFRVGNLVYVNPTFITITKDKETNDLKISGPMILSSNGIFLSEEELTTDFIAKVLRYEPYAIMGGIISKYQKDIVPEFLYQMKQMDKDFYDKLVSDYPEFSTLTPSHIGKYAKVATVNKNLEYVTSSGRFRFDDKDDSYIVGILRDSFALPFNAKEAEVRIKITDDMIVKIEREEEVTENTVFV